MRISRQRRRGWERGFTLLEVLVASTVLIMMLGLVFTAISGATSVTRRAGDRISSFQTARAGFDILTDSLSQATLNSYWDYVDSGGNFLTSSNAAGFTPSRYARRSELHFLIGAAGTGKFPGTTGTGEAVCFQAATGIAEKADDYAGLNKVLNAYGFYVEYGAGPSLPSPPFNAAPPQYRYRLMRSIVPAEKLTIYSSTTGDGWVVDLVSSGAPIADNVVYLAVWPRKSPADDPEGNALTSNFSYDSRLNTGGATQPETANQLPPILQVTMVALEEASAARLCTGAGAPSDISDAFTGLFGTSSSTQFESDLGELEKRLGAKHLGFRVFTASVPLRESKMQ